MDRERLQELLSGHLDGELNESETVEVETLLRESPEARALWDSYRSQGQALAALPGLVAPGELLRTTKARLKEPSPVHPQRAPRSSWVWLLGSLAACFAFLFLADLMEAGRDRVFYLTSAGIVAERPDGVEMVTLSSENDHRLVLLTPPFRAKVTSGTARVTWSADAGAVERQAMRVRLYLDLDGDEEYDLVEESMAVELDDREGFETLAVSFPLEGLWDDHGDCRAKVELSCETSSDQGIEVNLHPDRSQVILPLARFEEA